MSMTHSQCSHTNAKQSFQKGKVEKMHILVFTLLVFTYHVSTDLVSQKCKPLSLVIYLYFGMFRPQADRKNILFPGLCAKSG